MKRSLEIKAEIKALEAQRDDITSQIRVKNIAYLEALNDESEFKKGDKVRLLKEQYNSKTVFKPIGEGIFDTIFLRNGRPTNWVYKIKKDGQASQREWSPYDFDRIEKL